ncbi:MAG: fibrobacter succinogenes major paralogous domain-containing protein [Bacteroidales bacterium]|nr:fibrobacter succinogenes major paralogous domain-containing protein [Bacteroidales bacterium]
MKSIIYQIIVLIFMLIFASYASVFSQEECTIKLSADAHPCTCINNGEFIFKLTKGTTCVIDSNNIRYSLFSPANSISSVNSISPVFNNLPPGEYTAIVTALNHTGGSGPDAVVILSDTLKLTLSSSYTEPNMGVLNNEYTLSSPFGKVRSLPCKATGIVQLQIKGGKLPYTIQVLKLNGSAYLPYKTTIFDSIQHHGTNPAQMDYHEYYNIDSLSAGNYRFVFTDACGYSLPYYDVVLGEISSMSSGTSPSIKAQNEKVDQFNTFFINNFTPASALGSFAQKAEYYVSRQEKGEEIYWEYRWIDPSVNGQPQDTSGWIAFDFGEMEHTVATAEKYCDLWGLEGALEIKDVNCHNSVSYPIQFIKPQILFRYFEKNISFPELNYSYTDSCGRHRYSAQKRQYDYDFSPYDNSHKLFTVNGTGSRNVRYYIIDTETDTIIQQGITEKYGGRDLSYRQIFEFDSIYHGKTAKFKVTDAMNCTIAEREFIVSSKISGSISNPSFSLYGLLDTANFCGHSTTTEYINFPIGLSDLDTFQITDSPGGLSNMTMVYKASLGQWTRLDSNPNISISKHFGDWAINGMRSKGKFTFNYKSCCYNIITEQSLSSNNSGIGKYYEPSPASYKIEPSCIGIRIIPLQGSYKQYGYDLDTNTPFVNNVQATFRVYGNPSSPETITGYYHLGDTIDILIEGDIRIEMCDNYNYTNPNHLCHFRDTLIHCSKTPLQYDYFYSYCCEIGDSVSTVRTRAKGGIPPYLYLIRDKSGNLIDSNRTGDFFNVPLPHHDTVSLKVFDQCGTNFIYEGQVIEQRLIKKAWFTDGNSYRTQEDSSYCQLFAISLDNIDYQWQGPGGFASNEQNPSFFIPVDSNMSGKYYLSIQDSTCGVLRDSLMFKVLTKNHIPELLWIEDSICSGQSYEQYGFSIHSSPIDTLRILHDTLISILDDSTFLKLTILPVYRQTHVDSIVTSLDSYLYGGILLTDTGLYEIKFKTACGCDSIVYVHLMFSKYLPCPDAIDYNGNVYPAIRLDKYCWLAENLKSLNYSDGRKISSIYEYSSESFPDANANVAIFGRLYDWFAAMDTGKHALPDSHGNIQGVCPEGWLMPTPEDFSALYNYSVKQLRSPLYWLHNPGTNESGFTALPAGYYDAVQHRYTSLLGETYYWSSLRPDLPEQIYMIFFDCAELSQNNTFCNAYSVRCLKKDE